MKETVKTSRTAGYLEKIFRAVNRDWFGGELEEPITQFQNDSTEVYSVSTAWAGNTNRDRATTAKKPNHFKTGPFNRSL